MSSSAGAKGSKWTGHLEYYDYQTNTEKIFKEVSQLKDELSNDAIVKLYKMNHPFLSVFKHEFVIVQAGLWYHSIEKNAEEIVWQTSLTFKDLYKLKNKKRGSKIPNEIPSCKGAGDIYLFIDWLDAGKHLEQIYHVLLSNCQHFAKLVCDAEHEFKITDLLTADKIVAYNNFKELCFWEQWFTNNNVNEPSRDHRNEIVQTYDPHELNHILDVNRILPIYSSKDSSHVKPWMELQVSNDQSEMFRPYDPHLLIIMCMSYEIKSQVQLLSN
ncbi:uncharacterized protein LOC128207622 isoform X2 [Mya arenaria]|uniref:uncharacterized protein LOC128207622 isoform X2 n=1 Tax=Mya arenaria TaxID=6604 RepID=UPI0022DFB4F1|nr:uncharacterized protein LOC128207622 isoform X2 [Mya arenaria]